MAKPTTVILERLERSRARGRGAVSGRKLVTFCIAAGCSESVEVIQQQIEVMADAGIIRSTPHGYTTQEGGTDE